MIQFTGYTFHNLVGREVSVFAAGDASKITLAKMRESIDRGGEFRSEFKGVKRNGDEFDPSLIASPVLNEQSEVAYYLISIDDITSRKELEKKPVLQKENAETASRLKDAFISIPATGVGDGAVVRRPRSGTADIEKTSRHERVHYRG